MSFTKKTLGGSLALAVVIGLGTGSPAFAATGNFSPISSFDATGTVNDISIVDGSLLSSVEGASPQLLQTDALSNVTNSLNVRGVETGVVKNYGGTLFTAYNTEGSAGFASNVYGTWDAFGSPLAKAHDIVKDSNGFLWVSGVEHDGTSAIYLTIDNGGSWGKAVSSDDADSFKWLNIVNGVMYTEGSIYGDKGIHAYQDFWSKVSSEGTATADAKHTAVLGNSIYFADGTVFNTETNETRTADYGVGNVADFFVDGETLYVLGEGKAVKTTEGVEWESVSENIPAGSTSVAADSINLYVGTATGQLQVAELDGEQVVIPENAVPVFHGIAPLTFTVGDEIDLLTGVTATDEEDGDLTSTITHDGTNFDFTVPGEHSVTFSVTDSKGATTTASVNVSVVEKPNTAPVFSGIKDFSMVAGSTVDLLDGVTAHDNEDGDVTSSIETTSDLDKDVPGTYFVTYTVTDSDGASSEKEATVTVTPKPVPVNAAPVLNVGDKLTIKKGTSQANLLKMVTASDVEDGDLSSSVKIEGKVKLNKYGTHKVVFSVTDSAGEKTTKAVDVIVEKKKANTRPWFTGLKNETVKQGSKFDVRKGVQAHDREDGKLNYKVFGSVNTDRTGTYVLLYSAKDSHGSLVLDAKVVKVEGKKSNGKK